jgi:hypothetical protein
MKSKVEAVQGHALNNKYEVKVFRDNRTARIYTAYYSEPVKAYRLSQLFYRLNQLTGYRLITERVTWWEHLNGQS